MAHMRVPEAEVLAAVSARNAPYTVIEAFMTKWALLFTFEMTPVVVSSVVKPGRLVKGES